jgi:hypothetical protein
MGFFMRRSTNAMLVGTVTFVMLLMMLLIITHLALFVG